MALVIPPYHTPQRNVYYHPWTVHHEMIPQAAKTWQDDFGYILHPLRNIERSLEHTSDEAPAIDKDGFLVRIDVHQFKPNEINLKTRYRYIVIEGRHEERPDEHGFIMRQFERRYELPKDYDHTTVSSEMSTDGILTIRAKKIEPLKGNYRTIPIRHTGTAMIEHDAIHPAAELNPVHYKIINPTDHFSI